LWSTEKRNHIHISTDTLSLCIYRTATVNWSTLVTSGVVSSIIEKYLGIFYSLTIYSKTALRIKLINSSKALLDKFDTLPWALLAYLSI